VSVISRVSGPQGNLDKTKRLLCCPPTPRRQCLDMRFFHFLDNFLVLRQILRRLQHMVARRLQICHVIFLQNYFVSVISRVSGPQENLDKTKRLLCCPPTPRSQCLEVRFFQFLVIFLVLYLQTFKGVIQIENLISLSESRDSSTIGCARRQSEWYSCACQRCTCECLVLVNVLFVNVLMFRLYRLL